MQGKPQHFLEMFEKKWMHIGKKLGKDYNFGVWLQRMEPLMKSKEMFKGTKDAAQRFRVLYAEWWTYIAYPEEVKYFKITYPHKEVPTKALELHEGIFEVWKMEIVWCLNVRKLTKLMPRKDYSLFKATAIHKQAIGSK